MPISKPSPYDVIIVGAGVNGCACAYFLGKSALRVALIDREGIAAGGSGAAGAFISPKFSKGGPLKEIMAQAHTEALDFYATDFPNHALFRPLLHIANSPAESEKLAVYKLSTELSFEEIPELVRQAVVADAFENESIYLSRGAIIDAKGVCRAMAKGSDFFCIDVKTPIYDEAEKLWKIDGLEARNLIVTTGAYPKILPSDSVKLRAIWGHRIDIKTSTEVPCILHHYVSVSPSVSEGTIAIGATHDVHYNPFDKVPYDIQTGRMTLLEKASKTLKLNNIEFLADYMGLRSGTHDYFPICGPLVDEETTRTASANGCAYYPNAWMVNGSGGYGFVLAPYLAKRLAEHLTSAVDLDPALSPARFWFRSIKRQS
ncbi:MAG: NAD(P)/FAD-dependent oxidoreductase [Sulfuricurvum sp.]